MSDQPKKPDWERIELDYRAGLLSLREIAAKDGNVTEGAIRKRAKKEIWTRDLSAKVKARADELVRKQEVREQVRTDAAANERQTVEASAQAIAEVRIGHRSDIKRGRDLVMSLLKELEIQTGNVELMEQLGELMHAPDDNGMDKLNELYRKIISLSGRISNVKALSDALKNLIGLEREAWSMDEKKPDGSEQAKSNLSDAERASRLATILARAQAAMQAEAGGSSA